MEPNNNNQEVGAVAQVAPIQQAGAVSGPQQVVQEPVQNFFDRYATNSVFAFLLLAPPLLYLLFFLLVDFFERQNVEHIPLDGLIYIMWHLSPGMPFLFALFLAVINFRGKKKEILRAVGKILLIILVVVLIGFGLCGLTLVATAFLGSFM